VTPESPRTLLYGPLQDQDALHRLLTILESAGLEVVAFRRFPGAISGAAAAR
jgi:hypothetical protein